MDTARIFDRTALGRLGRLAAAAALVAAAAGCGDDAGDNPRVARLQSELALATERADSLERRLAQSLSEAGEAAALREELKSAQARVDELETPSGMAEGAREVEGLAETRRLLVDAVAALRAADRSLDALTASRAEAAEAAQPPSPEFEAMRDSLAQSAEAITAVAANLGLQISGLAR